MPHKFDPKNIDRLDTTERRRHLDPDAIVEMLGLRDGMSVADVGAGTGYFSVPLAGLFGGGLRVYALDISSEMLDALRLRAGGLDNIKCILTQEDAIPMDEETVDMALMVNVLHELDGDGTLREVLRILKRGGKLAVADWAKRPMLDGPPPSHRISEDKAVDRVTEIGFEFYDWFEPGPKHYGLIFLK
jgi:ubiquinone/menaquinone biosynthesis C-methylase UbiE